MYTLIECLLWRILQEDVDVGQAEGRDGDKAGRLVVEVFVEDAAWIDVALQLAIAPDLDNRFDGIGARVGFFKIAEVGELVAGDIDLLSRFEQGVALQLEEMGADDADGEEHETKVDEIAAVALAIAFDKHVEGKGIGFTVAVAYARAAPEFVEKSNCRK